MSNLGDLTQMQSRIGTGWGFAIVILGMLCIMSPFVSGMAVNTMVAILMGAAGLTMTVYAFKAGTFGKGLLQFLFGGITILAGVLLLARPMLGMFTMTAVLIAWFIVDGVFSIIAGIRGKEIKGSGWIIASGVASIILGILLWREWPASGTYAVGLLVGIRLIFTGWSIAMLGMMSDTAVDVVDETAAEVVDEAIAESLEEPKPEA